MQYTKIFLGVIFSIYFLIIIVAMIKSKRFIKLFLLTVLQGLCSLFAVNLLGQYITIHIPVNVWSLGISSIGGIPGVVLMLLCDGFIC